MPLKQLQFWTEKPVIYADSNIYRYVKHGELELIDPDRFIWAYSHVHLDEIASNKNFDALEGMKILRAVEVSDNLNSEFKSIGNIVLNPFVDPHLRFQDHLDAISGYEKSQDLFSPLMTRLYGAKNFDELLELPANIVMQIKKWIESIDHTIGDSIVSRAENVAKDLLDIINKELKEVQPIDKTRTKFGLSSEKRKEIEKTDSPIHELWEILKPYAGELNKYQFFGLEPIPNISKIQHTQDGAIAGAHAVLNMIGFSPDKGLSKVEKFKNITSDGAHIGMASYCNAMLSSDSKLCSKAHAIYKFINYKTGVLYFQFKPNGSKLYLKIGN